MEPEKKTHAHNKSPTANSKSETSAKSVDERKKQHSNVRVMNIVMIIFILSNE